MKKSAFPFNCKSKMSHDEKDLHTDTICVHGGYVPRDHHHAANPPIYLSSTFEFDTAEACAKAFAGCPEENQNHIYSRLSNPTNSILESKLAKLEGAEAAVCAASGMGAISSVFWTFLAAGKTIISSNRVYGCTFALLEHQLTRFGINVVFVDMTNIDQVKAEAAKAKDLAMIYTELIQNPTNDVVDLEAISVISKQYKCKLVVDNTFGTPLSCQVLKFGADIVVHSATKYLMGGIFVGGVVAGSQKDIDAVRFIGIKDCTGAVMDPVLAFAMAEQIETLHLRLERMSENTEKLARFFEAHPKVERVVCTGLSSHPQAGLCKKYLKLTNSIISVYFKGGYDDCCAVMNKLNLTLRAVSLGKTHSLANHPASMTHSTYTKAEREQAGIADNLVRISVGVEFIDDLLADWKLALE